MKRFSLFFVILIIFTACNQQKASSGFTEDDAVDIAAAGGKAEVRDSLAAAGGAVDGTDVDISAALALIKGVCGDDTTPLASAGSPSGTAVSVGETRTAYELVASIRGQMYKTFIEPAAGGTEIFDGAGNEVAFGGVGLGLGAAGLAGAALQTDVIAEVESLTTAQAVALGHANANAWHTAAAAHDAYIADLLIKAPGTTIVAIMGAVRTTLAAAADRGTLVGAPAGADLRVYPVDASEVTTANGHIGAALRADYT